MMPRNQRPGKGLFDVNSVGRQAHLKGIATPALEAHHNHRHVTAMRPDRMSRSANLAAQTMAAPCYDSYASVEPKSKPFERS